MGAIRIRLLAAACCALILPAFAGCSTWPQSKESRQNRKQEWADRSKGVYDRADRYRVKVRPDQKRPSAGEEKSSREAEITPHKEEKGEATVEELPFLPSKKEAVAPSESKAAEGIPVSVRFEGAALDSILDTIIVGILEESYILEVNPREKLSINIEGTFSRENMLTTLQIVLNSMNLGLVRHEGVYHIVQAKDAPAIADNMRMLVRIPRYVRVENMIPVLRDLKSESGKLVTIQGSNLLYMLDYPANVKRAEALVGLFDVAFFEDRYVRIYSLKDAFAQDVASELRTLLKEYNVFTDKVPAHVRVMAVERLNKIIAFATSQDTLDYLDTWVAILDQEKDEGDEPILFTYKPKYSNVTELARVLGNLFPKLEKNVLRGLDAHASADSDLLMIRARRSVYREARELISHMDSQPHQVYVQAVLAEIQLTDDMELGFEWFFNERYGSTDVEIGSTLGNLTGKALNISLVGSDFFSILSMLVKEQEAEVLATPHILVTNKEAASIEIKRRVPVIKSFLTTDIQAGGTSAQQPSIEYMDAGIILKVEPNIISRDEVELILEQEMSSPTEISLLEGLNSFQFDTRSVKTKLLLQNRQTILIGGLIREENRTETSRTPCLGDLPLIRHLFTSEGENRQRTELVLFMTPVVVTNANELKNLSDQMTAVYSPEADRKTEQAPPGDETSDNVAP